jgi:hypothetical protein
MSYYSITPQSTDATECCQDLWYACFSNHSTCIKKLISKGKKFRTKVNNSLVNDDYSVYIAIMNDLELLQHCVANGCPIHPDTIIFSVKDINMMKWMIDQGQPIHPDMLVESYNARSFESFKYLVKHFKYINSSIFERAMSECNFRFAFYILFFAFSNETELDDKIKKTNRMYICMSMNKLLDKNAYFFETNEDYKLMIKMLYKYIKNTKFIVSSNLTYLSNALMEIKVEKQSTFNALLENTQICTDVSKLVCEYI